MDLTNFAGKVAIGVSIAIVLAFIGLLVLAVFCVGLGAYESATNPHISQDTASAYRNASAQIARGQAGISDAVRNVTGG